MKRAHGLGSITKLADGRLWVRAARQPDGSRPSLGYATTDDEANALLALDQKKQFRVEGCPSFERWVDTVLDEREGEDVRGIRQERSRAKHLKAAHFAKKPLDKVTAADILQWVRALQKKEAGDRRGKRKIARSTVTRCLSLASVVFQAAVGIHIDTNPCNGIEVKKDTRVDEDEDREEVWDWLRLEEQRAFLACDAVPEWARLLVAFAWGTGLRQGEQWNLKWKDVHDDVEHPYVFVRVGSKGKRPKSGKTRRVALFGDALHAIRRWRQIIGQYLTERPTTGRVYKNEHDLVWPTPRGCRRQSGAPEKSVRNAQGKKVVKVELLPEWLKAAGVERELRWHDLRHTFCSSLVSGIWGAAWTLEEVRDAAGHSSVTVAEKYAHLCETTQQKAVARMGCGLVGGGSADQRSVAEAAAISSEFDPLSVVGPPGLEPGTYGLKVPGVLELLRALASENASHNPLVTNLAAALATALERPS